MGGDWEKTNPSIRDTDGRPRTGRRRRSDSVVKHDTIVEFESTVGNKVCYPSQWTVDEDGSSFSVTSPDGQAVISFYTFTVDGSGSFQEFQEFMLSKLEGNWQESTWIEVAVNGITASKKSLTPPNDDDPAWLVYILQSGDYYHAILANASSIVMFLNGGFYEGLIRSFKSFAQKGGND